MGLNGQGGEIRTHDLLLPKQARYRTTLHPDCVCILSDLRGLLVMHNVHHRAGDDITLNSVF